MTHTETRTLSYALAGSLAVHVALAVAFALWIGLVSFHRIHFTPRVVEEEPEVTLVFPEPTPLPPVVPPKKESYIRTTQNTEAPQAPVNADFESDKNTVAMAKSAASPDGDKALPTTQGINLRTNELADRTFREGETKNDSAAASATAVVTPAPPKPPSPSPPRAPELKTPEPVAQPQIAKKEDARAETMMKDLDAALAKQDKLPEQVRKPEETRDALPIMRSPEEKAVPQAIPVAARVPDTSRAEKDAFQPETHRGSTKGGISHIGGEDAVNAAATPVGRYQRLVLSAIEKKWHHYRLIQSDALEPGKMGLHFYVNKDGKIEDLEFIFKESKALMEEFTIKAIQEATIPPIPKDLLLILEKERLPMDIDVVILPR